jgi:arsenate reductase
MLPLKVLFLCARNSCRSQMAEGLLRHFAGGVLEVSSAGTNPRPVHALAVRSMAEIGVDIGAQQSKPVERFLAEPFDWVITLCDEAKESCPVFPGPAKKLHWRVRDPAAARGSEEKKMQVFRAVRDELMTRVEEWTPDLFDHILSLLSQQKSTEMRRRKSPAAHASV